MKDLNVDVGKRIRQQRELLGYTREELSEMISISAIFCRDIELGKVGISTQTLINLSNALRLSTDYILFGDKRLNIIDTQILNILETFNDREQNDILELIKVYLKIKK